MSSRILLATGFLLVSQAAALSSLYPAVDPVLLANAFNISSGCLDALNETVACDDTLLRMAGSVDNYLWDIDNVTDLCTLSCLSSASDWFTAVSGNCANDVMSVNGRLVPPLTIPGRVVDGMNIACLTADTNVLLDPGVNASIITSKILSEANSTVTADTTLPTATFSTGTVTDTPFDSDFSMDTRSSSKRYIGGRQISGTSSSSFCLIESYSWTGSDIIRPDCSDSSNSNASQCLDPTDVPANNERIANLYPDSLLCSDCFIKMFYLRVASPYLPDLDYSDYLVGQYFDIIDVCAAEMPDLTVRTLPYYDYVPGTFDGIPDNDTGITNSSAPVACGQTLGIKEFQETGANPNATSLCDSLSSTYNVSTGDLQLAFDNPYCIPGLNFTSVCVPEGCTVLQLSSNTSCDAVAELITTTDNNITTTQLATWNPNLIGLCDQLPADQYICISAPGGSYVSPPASNSTSSDASQQRGGGDGTETATGSGSAVGGGRNATTIEEGGTAPSPTQSGITPSCTEFAMANSGDGCYSLTTLWQISEDDFYTWNTILGPGGVNCSTELFAGYYYCIDAQSATATSTAPSSMPTTVATPSPVQTGIDPKCTAYAEAARGGTCTTFSEVNGITTAELYEWNLVLGTNGAACSTAFEADVYYCIGAPAVASTTTATTAPAPTATQAGIVSNCNKYAEAQPGGTCGAFADDNGITTTQLYTWNTVLGTDGANCGSSFWADEYYCVGISS